MRTGAWLTTLRVTAVALVAIAVLRVAWVSDDALITLRTALNITHGWGPGFNATESVQAYTHPLWFLLWVTLGTWTSQWILGLLGLSIVLTAGAVALVVWRTSSIPRLIVVTGLLLLSNAFIEYATSGLENPLAYALVGLLFAICADAGHRGPLGRRLPAWGVALLAGLTVAAIVLTRFDLALLVAPAVVLLMVRARKRWRLLLVGGAAAALPLLAWFLWSQATYATWLPNTFEAKRNLDIPQSELVVQGLRYLYVSFEHDPVTLVALLVGVVAAFAARSVLSRTWAAGVVLYVGYVIWVGGDFMAGRFLAVPVYVAAFLIATLPPPSSRIAESDTDDGVREPEAVAVAVSVGIVAVLLVASVAAGSTPTSLANPQDQRWQVDQNINAGVSDERGVYVANGRSLKGLIDNLSLAYLTPNIVPIGDGTGLNRVLRDLDKEAKEWPQAPAVFTQPSEVGVFCGFLGTIGMATGPITHLIDACALTDRFLAEHPYVPASPFAWKPGHFERKLPAGYVEAVQTGDPSRVQDPRERFELTELWSRIRSS